MSRSSRFFGTALACSLVLAWSAAAVDIVLKDGSVIQASKPYQTKGTTALITLKDGTLVSVPISRIDQQRTAEMAAKPKDAPAPVAAPTAPLTPAEAAKQKRRKATVSLNDEQVAHPFGENAAGTAASGSTDAGGKVEITGVTPKRGPNGLSVTGTVTNTGSSEASGITVAVEGINGDNKTLTTVFATVAKTTLGPGETATFSADVPVPGVVNVRTIPRWQVLVAPPADAGAQQQQEAAPQPTRSPAPAAQPAPPPQAQPTVIPRGDIAAPPANAPTNPGNPNSGYLPGTSPGAQPKPIK